MQSTTLEARKKQMNIQFGDPARSLFETSEKGI
jgi:hypothetical protein